MGSCDESLSMPKACDSLFMRRGKPHEAILTTPLIAEAAQYPRQLPNLFMKLDVQDRR